MHGTLGTPEARRQPPRRSPLPLTLRLALRELRGGLSGFVVFLFCIALGVAAMLLVRILEKRVKGPAGLMSVTGIDILVDGLVLGIAFAAGAKAGILLTVALTIEVLFLGLTVANELGEGGASKGKVVGLTAALVLLLPLGALLGGPVGSLPAAVQAGFLSFGLIALLYLVTEELLIEAHETEDRPWVTAMFFAGFLLLLLLDGMIG